MPCYLLHAAASEPDLADWNSPTWDKAEELRLEYVFSESSDHHPDTRVKLLYDRKHIYGIYRVDDRYVRAAHQGNQAPVCLDSCVEFFVFPAESAGYLNFEMNCGGSLLSYFIRDSRRRPGGFADFSKLSDAELDSVKRVGSLPALVDPELAVPTVWTMGFAIPLTLLEQWAPALKGKPLAGQRWRGGFFKCGDQTSHPHWIAWQPVPELNFHRPDCFGELYFA